MRIELRSDGSENVPYNFPDFPVHARRLSLSAYPGGCFVGHWHDDLEFVAVLRGRMRYEVNGEPFHLKEGEGMFVNARQMHAGRVADGGDCDFLCVVFHPSLLFPSRHLEGSYAAAMCGEAALGCKLLTPSDETDRAALSQLGRLYDLCEEAGEGFELGALSAILQLGHLLFRSVAVSGGSRQPSDRRLSELRDMIGFVQKHYQNPIALQDIAAAGNMCRSGCCDVFRKVMRLSPIAYLTNYRVEKGAELLGGTALPVTEIALMCGFSSPSYFSEVFRERMGCAPSEYRKRIGKEPPSQSGDAP